MKRITKLTVQTAEELAKGDAQSSAMLDKMRQMVNDRLVDLTDPSKVFDTFCSSIMTASEFLKRSLDKGVPDFDPSDPNHKAISQQVMNDVGFPVIVVGILGEAMMKHLAKGATSLTAAEMDLMARQAGVSSPSKVRH